MARHCQEQETLIREVADWCGFASAEAFLEQMLIELHDQERYIHAHRAEFSAMIEEGWQAAQRGELLTSDEAKQQIAEMKRDFLAMRSAAA